VTYKDIGGVHASKANVSLALGYFSNVGWLQWQGKGKYVPSDELVQYFMGFNKESVAQKLADKILSSNLGMGEEGGWAETKGQNETSATFD
jgi:hypothetical protein